MSCDGRARTECLFSSHLKPGNLRGISRSCRTDKGNWASALRGGGLDSKAAPQQTAAPGSGFFGSGGGGTTAGKWCNWTNQFFVCTLKSHWYHPPQEEHKGTAVFPSLLFFFWSLFIPHHVIYHWSGLELGFWAHDIATNWRRCWGSKKMCSKEKLCGRVKVQRNSPKKYIHFLKKKKDLQWT